MTKNRTITEYFAGIGLMRMGFEPSGWDVIFANDISRKKLEMYRAFYPATHDHYILSDVFDLDPSDIPSSTIATCSFPCIDLSLAGNLNGINGEHSSAFWGFIKALERQGRHRPEVVLIENVPGWLTSNNGEDFRATVQAVNSLGYQCDAFVLNALRFVPQSRLRVFLVGVRELDIKRGSTGILERPASLASKRLKEAVYTNDDLEWGFLDIPNPPPLLGQGLSEIIENVEPESPDWWEEGEVQRHLDMMAQSHRARIQRLIDDKSTSHRTFYRRRRVGRLRVEVRHGDTAGCLRTAVGGSSRQFIIKAGNGHVQMRSMTPREYARLQGVPDSYPIAVPKNQALTGFGDAVCVPAIRWIADSVVNPLMGDTNLEDRPHREREQRDLIFAQSSLW